MQSCPRSAIERRSRGRSTAVVLAFLLVSAISLSAPAGPAGVEHASAAKPGRWIGTTQGTAQRSSRWVSGGSTQQGDFWFTVDRRGQVSGQAVVAYTPTFDTDGLNALLGYARGLTQAALGGVPLVGAFGAAQLNAFIGVKIRYDDQLAIRQSPITGTLSDGRLSLRWARGRPEGIPFRASLTTLKGEKPLTGGSLTVKAPFAGTAQVADGHAVATQTSKSKDKGVTDQATSYWTAHRVGSR